MVFSVRSVLPMRLSLSFPVVMDGVECRSVRCSGVVQKGIDGKVRLPLSSARTTAEQRGLSMEKRFSASLSRSQGRNAWSVIFRHPGRIDRNTGKPGLRVRQGLGTADESEARDLIEKLNQLLADPTFWTASA